MAPETANVHIVFQEHQGLHERNIIGRKKPQQETALSLLCGIILELVVLTLLNNPPEISL